MSMTFKEELENSLIPAIKRMIENESAHLEMLKKYQVTHNGGFLDFILKTDIEKMIIVSQAYLTHLEERLDDYVKYAQNLNI